MEQEYIDIAQKILTDNYNECYYNADTDTATNVAATTNNNENIFLLPIVTITEPTNAEIGIIIMDDLKDQDNILPGLSRQEELGKGYVTDSDGNESAFEHGIEDL
nr:9908_t:CDS:2 [Entrophospora candida]